MVAACQPDDQLTINWSADYVNRQQWEQCQTQTWFASDDDNMVQLLTSAAAAGMPVWHGAAITEQFSSTMPQSSSPASDHIHHYCQWQASNCMTELCAFHSQNNNKLNQSDVINQCELQICINVSVKLPYKIQFCTGVMGALKTRDWKTRE